MSERNEAIRELLREHCEQLWETQRNKALKAYFDGPHDPYNIPEHLKPKELTLHSAINHPIHEPR